MSSNYLQCYNISGESNVPSLDLVIQGYLERDFKKYSKLLLLLNDNKCNTLKLSDSDKEAFCIQLKKMLYQCSNTKEVLGKKYLNSYLSQIIYEQLKYDKSLAPLLLLCSTNTTIENDFKQPDYGHVFFLAFIQSDFFKRLSLNYILKNNICFCDFYSNIIIQFLYHKNIYSPGYLPSNLSDDERLKILALLFSKNDIYKDILKSNKILIILFTKNKYFKSSLIKDDIENIIIQNKKSVSIVNDNEDWEWNILECYNMSNSNGLLDKTGEDICTAMISTNPQANIKFLLLLNDEQIISIKNNPYYNDVIFTEDNKKVFCNQLKTMFDDYNIMFINLNDCLLNKELSMIIYDAVKCGLNNLELLLLCDYDKQLPEGLISEYFPTFLQSAFFDKLTLQYVLANNIDFVSGCSLPMIKYLNNNMKNLEATIGNRFLILLCLLFSEDIEYENFLKTNSRFIYTVLQNNQSVENYKINYISKMV